MTEDVQGGAQADLLRDTLCRGQERVHPLLHYYLFLGDDCGALPPTNLYASVAPTTLTWLHLPQNSVIHSTNAIKQYDYTCTGSQHAIIHYTQSVPNVAHDVHMRARITCLHLFVNNTMLCSLSNNRNQYLLS